MSFEPLTGRRRVEVTERRRKQEFAQRVRRIAEEDYPEASKKIRLVLDNLSTHTPAAFYEAFDPERARLLARRVEFCYTSRARLVAEHGRDRDLRFGEAVPQAETAGRGGARAGDEGMGNGTQPFGGERGLALQHTRRPHQATEPLPSR